MSLLGKRKNNTYNLSDSNKKIKLYNNNDFKTFTSYKSIICGYRCTFSISQERKVFSFGLNEFKKLGHDNEACIINPLEISLLKNIKMVDCGNNFTICINFEGECFSFGCNSFGQLGLGNNSIIKQTSIPQKINIIPIDRITCGSLFTICKCFKGNIYSFGENSNGELGTGDYNFYKSPKQILELQDIELISCGSNNVFCKSQYNTIYVWGKNISNTPKECDLYPSNIVSISCGQNISLFLTSDGIVYKNEYYSYTLYINPPVLVNNIPLIRKISCGLYHAMCIDIDYNLWVLGKNSNGQLGLGNYNEQKEFTLHSKVNNIIDFSSGGVHTFVKTIDNKIYAFGASSKAEIGIRNYDTEQVLPIQVLINNEEKWDSFLEKSKQKSARK